MQRVIFALAAAILLLFLAAPSARCQVSASPSVPNNEFGLWGGASFGNPTGIGTTTDRQLAIVGLRYSRTIWEPADLSLRYTLDILPLESLNQPTFINCAPPGSSSPEYCQNGRETAYGGGINPIGLKLNFLRRSQWQPFIASTAGFVAYVDKVPYDIPLGTQFNFTFDFQGGIQRFNSSRTRAWTLGYKYQHISNANRSSFNPGVDFNVLYIGYSFFR